MSVSELVKVKEVKALGKQPWSTNDAPIVLTAKARRVDKWKLQNDTPAELQQSPIYTETADEEIELIPLGCARLRMSCLPVVTSDSTANEWKETPTDVPPENRAATFEAPYKA